MLGVGFAANLPAVSENGAEVTSALHGWVYIEARRIDDRVFSARVKDAQRAVSDVAFPTGFRADPRAASVYDSVVLFAHAASLVLKRLGHLDTSSAVIREAIRNISFMSQGRRVLMNGNGIREEDYTVSNLLLATGEVLSVPLATFDSVAGVLQMTSVVPIWPGNTTELPVAYRPNLSPGYVLSTPSNAHGIGRPVGGAPIIVQCYSIGACLGGVDFACAPGYTGRRCGYCDAGHYWAGRLCKQCFQGNALSILLAIVTPIIIIMVGFCVLLYSACSENRIVAFVPLLDMLQVIGMMATLDMPFDRIISTLISVAGLSNVDFGILQIDCVFPVSVDGYLGRPRLYLIAAFALIPTHLALYGLLRLAKFVRPSLTFGGLLATEKRLREALLNVLYCCLSLLHTPVLMQWINIFICQDNPDETASLHAAPGIDCYTEAWHSAQVEASVSFTTWGFVYPLLLGLHMRRRHEDDDFMAGFSLMAYGYRKKRFWWEPFGMLRRICLAVVLVVFRSQRYAQAAFVVVTVMGFIVVSLLTRPFLNPILTVIHVLSDVTVLLIVASGIVSASGGLGSNAPSLGMGSSAAIAAVVLVRSVARILLASHRTIAGSQPRLPLRDRDGLLGPHGCIFQSRARAGADRARHLALAVASRVLSRAQVDPVADSPQDESQ